MGAYQICFSVSLSNLVRLSLFALLYSGCSSQPTAVASERDASISGPDASSSDASAEDAPSSDPLRPVDDTTYAYNINGLIELNLKRTERGATDYPLIPFRTWPLGQSGLGLAPRIPTVVYYAPGGGSGFLAIVPHNIVVELDNETAKPFIPAKALGEVESRGIDYTSIQVLVSFGMLPKEHSGDPPIRTHPVSLFPHNWVHDTITSATNLSIQVAAGLFDAYNVSVAGSDMQSNGPIGIDELKTYGAFIHPSGSGSSAYSSRQALFQIDPNQNVSDFWALCIDVDPASAHKNSAILLYFILFPDAVRTDLNNGQFFGPIFDADEEAALKSPPSARIELTASRIVSLFERVEIDSSHRSRIAGTLSKLFQRAL